MIDFVHLNWFSFKKEKPMKDEIYLFLVKDKTRNKTFVQSIAYLDGSILSAIFNGTDPRFEIIAWADPNGIAFDCDPEHYHECGKKNCDICDFSNDCSTCHKTVKLEHAKWLDWFR